MCSTCDSTKPCEQPSYTGRKVNFNIRIPSTASCVSLSRLLRFPFIQLIIDTVDGIEYVSLLCTRRGKKTTRAQPVLLPRKNGNRRQISDCRNACNCFFFSFFFPRSRLPTTSGNDRIVSGLRCRTTRNFAFRNKKEESKSTSTSTTALSCSRVQRFIFHRWNCFLIVLRLEPLRSG